MNNIKNIVLAVAITLISICGITFALLEKLEVEEQGVINYNDNNEVVQSEKKVDEIEQKKEIYVQLTGAVNLPGVYKVTEGTRVFELIILADGLTNDADDVVVNQAREVKDEENIYIPTKEEVASGVYQIDSSSQLININTATVTQLMELTGIGESKAKSIMSYRDKNGDFNSVEDIMNVPGIKESVFEIIKDLITV